MLSMVRLVPFALVSKESVDARVQIWADCFTRHTLCNWGAWRGSCAVPPWWLCCGSSMYTSLSSAFALCSWPFLLQVLSETSSHGRYKLEPFVLRNFMRLDAAAIRALNLMPSATDGARSVSNVYGRINATKTGPQCSFVSPAYRHPSPTVHTYTTRTHTHTHTHTHAHTRTHTAMGARKLLAWLRAPLLDVPLIERRHSCVESLFSDVVTREQLRGTALRTMPDVQKLLSRFTRGKATLLDVLKLYQAVQGIPAIIK
jgi:DNA mismatch repair protein MSH2